MHVYIKHFFDAYLRLYLYSAKLDFLQITHISYWPIDLKIIFRIASYLSLHSILSRGMPENEDIYLFFQAWLTLELLHIHKRKNLPSNLHNRLSEQTLHFKWLRPHWFYFDLEFDLILIFVSDVDTVLKNKYWIWNYSTK